MTTPELSRTARIDTLGDVPRTVSVTADAAEREGLAKRFGLVALDSLEAEVALTRNGVEVHGTGRLKAEVTQACVASGAPVAERIDESFTILFRPEPDAAAPDEEVELHENEMDVVFYEGAMVDVGEAVAETLALSLDPYPRAPDADAILRDAGVKSEEEAGPFGALSGLRDRLEGKP